MWPRLVVTQRAAMLSSRLHQEYVWHSRQAHNSRLNIAGCFWFSPVWSCWKHGKFPCEKPNTEFFFLVIKTCQEPRCDSYTPACTTLNPNDCAVCRLLPPFLKNTLFLDKISLWLKDLEFFRIISNSQWSYKLQTVIVTSLQLQTHHVVCQASHKV